MTIWSNTTQKLIRKREQCDLQDVQRNAGYNIKTFCLHQGTEDYN